MALEDILANIRNQSLAQTADDRTVNRIGPVQLNRPKNLTALDRKYADPGDQPASRAGTSGDPADRPPQD